MHIKEVIIDGFKSYANRTVISGWDKEFNAITGFNGTGKSNILDSICFVLGITNLSQVRCSSLNELIYKQGQSRVNRASVTIVFDNSETKKSPIGFESYAEITVTRQVVVGGRNKYLINGHTAQLQRVQNLFHSVGLNVNNPHFLIMQGRITKVCNMKPLETLGMIEEAAGTKMFEQKKQAAEKTILKKQAKVDEIERVMTEEIQPVLDQLRSEKQNFYRYNANRNEIETLQRMMDAWAYYQNSVKMTAVESEIASTQDAVNDLTSQVSSATAAQAGKQRAIAEMNAQREREFLKNEKYLAMEEQSNAYSKELVQVDQQWKNAQASFDEESKEAKKLEKLIDASAKAVEAKKKEHAAAEEKLTAVTSEHKRLTDDIAHIKSAQLGINVSSEGGDSAGQGGLAGQLMGLQKELAQEEGALQSATTKLKHAAAALKEQEKKLAAVEKSGDSATKALATKAEQVEKLTEKLKTGGATDAQARTKLDARVSSLKDETGALQYEVDALSARLGSRLRFDYNARAAGLDASKVKGLVANLVRVPDVQHTTAVETIAGGKLYNVVVDTEESGKALLEKGQLKKRVTIIPLNKIQARNIPAGVQAKAEQIAGGKENVKVALSVVGYDAEVQAAMAYIFGTSFVVGDSSLAPKICFHPEVRTKCVTLDGDVYDPSGTLEGGALPSGPSVLQQLIKLNDLQSTLDAKTAELKTLSAQLASMAAAEKETADVRKKLDILQIELKSLRERQEQSEHYALAQSVESGRKTVVELNGVISGFDGRKASLVSRMKEVEKMLKDFEGERAKSMKDMDARLASLQKEVAAGAKKLADAQKKVSMLSIELKELQAEHATLESQLAKLRDDLKSSSSSIAAAEKLVAEKRAAFDAFESTLAGEKAKFAAMDKSLGKLQKELAALQKQAADAGLEVKKVSNTLTRLQGDRAEMIKTQLRMEKEYAWIVGERHMFGKAGSEYDFARSGSETSARLAALQSEQEALSKKINKKVMGMFEKAESEAAELNKKRAIILDDKAQIEHVIAQLDVEKTKTLEATWQTVSDAFGTIFGTLLPGVSAKLVKADGARSVMDGLDIKVAFGGIEKESLTELSGGQRSLLALSLILALLKFKPAPMYILDEIDAALDLSHTQNIGKVLKNHFSESQFIVVSLKEGMFNNANVLFRTKFQDGVSGVVRTSLQERQGGKMKG